MTLESHKSGPTGSVSEGKGETVGRERSKGDVVFSSKISSESAERPVRRQNRKRGEGGHGLPGPGGGQAPVSW